MSRFFSSILILLIVILLGNNFINGIDKDKILDMSYTFDEQTIYWPTANPFKLIKVADGPTKSGYYYRSNDYGASEHGGTHADAPSHFSKEGKFIHQIPLHQWIGPAVKIDVTQKCEKDRDYRLMVTDIKDWEKRYKKIPKGSWVIMYTGIDTKFYPDPIQVLGTDKKKAAAIPDLHFPGFSAESIKFLLKERDINGIAIDTPSIDYGQSKDFIVHQLICGANKLAVENIANLDKLPSVGAMLYVMPINIKGGTGAPSRVFAILP